LEDFLAEDEALISFHSEDTDFEFTAIEKTIRWINDIIAWRSCELVQLTYVFCSDDYLHKMNLDYLDHDTLTDIITFPYLEPPKIEWDIFISVDRVQDNARHFNVSFEQELRRVIIHGVLHLCGQGDKTETEAEEMRRLEEAALQRF
jgi:rRNA maturation RNase YbeY